MLAKGDGSIANVLIVVAFIAIMIVRGIVEYFRRQKVEEEVKKKRLQQKSGDRPESDGEETKRPARGLEALLEALAERGTRREQEPPPPPARGEPRRAERPGEVWDATGEIMEEGGSLIEPSTLELEGTRTTEAEFGRGGRREVVRAPPAVASFDAHRAEREAETRRQEERALELREEAARIQEVRPSDPSPRAPMEAPVPAAAVGIAPAFARLAAEGESPSVKDARKGVLWSVVLGRPRALSAYGERGASDPPGGTF